MQDEGNFVQSIFADGEYDALLGTNFALEQSQDRQGKMRTRTLLIKYWQYCLTDGEAICWRSVD